MSAKIHEPYLELLSSRLKIKGNNGGNKVSRLDNATTNNSVASVSMEIGDLWRMLS